MNNLHSIMYLLIPSLYIKEGKAFIKFTFNNVSINSFLFVIILPCCSYAFIKFTFHNVSINSHRQSVKFLHQSVFTFHNVSINSMQKPQRKQIQKHIYIP